MVQQHDTVTLGALGLFVRSNGTLLSRLLVALAMVAAALPVMAWWIPAGWMLVVVAFGYIETRFAAELAKGEPDAVARIVRRIPVLTTLSTTNYAIFAALFWITGNRVAMLFAVIMVMVTLFYLVLQYCARPKLLTAAISPLLLMVGFGSGHLMWLCWQSSSPATAVTVLMGLVVVSLYCVASRGRLAKALEDLVTARSHAEERGIAAEAASEAKSAFLATMTHEIRTPLNGVLGMAQAMSVDDLCPMQRERLDVIRKSGEALLTILNDVLDFSKIEAGKLEIEEIEFDLGSLVRGTQLFYAGPAQTKGLELSLEILPEVEGAYRGDPTRIRQILGNLLSNAIKFTARGEIRLLVTSGPKGVIFVVQDTGEGVTPQQLDKLFDRFVQADASTTRRHGGAGLGLAICRELAELMGGSIQARSSRGEGSSFILTLPLVRMGASRADETEANAPLAAEMPELRVLAAEDNAVNQLVLKTLLQQVGVNPVIVANGQEAVESWRSGEWDVILMDVQMPQMDGPTATRMIREEEAQSGRPRTPIIALTANAMAHQVVEYRAAGMDQHISKPIDAAALYETLSAVLTDQADAAAA